MTAVRFAAQHTTAACSTAGAHRKQCGSQSQVRSGSTYVCTQQYERKAAHSSLRSFAQGSICSNSAGIECATRRFQAPGSLFTKRLLVSTPFGRASLHHTPWPHPNPPTQPIKQSTYSLHAMYVCRNQMMPDDHHQGKDHDEEQEKRADWAVAAALSRSK